MLVIATYPGSRNVANAVVTVNIGNIRRTRMANG